ncbi:hypothetical protein A8C56_21665 [Niabella ginsenosidivorans]|uniref:DUF4175 domain-containing protein n=1 Tax=Niabella ginsenosidivorans TaxID=1176587 RepID=A0A1A9I6D3_9BACT|nr:hypothetical protein [Niabella ginsenosidivorans]ANH83238.1 hypothetical protein A8C56_21665 [Niabella ginsenosidivorans]
MKQYKKNVFVRLWGMPVVLFILTLAGLILCLVKEGVWDVLAWIALALPMVLILKYLYWQKNKEK